jgi:16S rRNA (guanine966-N2)-methyltransferase
LRFPSLPQLRPTPKRVRETLFNWLSPILSGSRCLDLFAGSGALGIEALSRGAIEVLFVEYNQSAVAALRNNLARLAVSNARVEAADVLSWLHQPGTPFEIILLDPPFKSNLLALVCESIETGGWLSHTAQVYIETEKSMKGLVLPINWKPYRERTAGAVTYRLLKREN